jgi:hypothetical protein
MYRDVPANLILLKRLLDLFQVGEESDYGSSAGARDDKTNSLSVAILCTVAPKLDNGPSTSASIFLEYVWPVTG